MNYHAYLVRLWREHEQAPWRAELVVPHTHERHLFASTEQLYRFVEETLGEPVSLSASQLVSEEADKLKC